jgi:BirA family biotin operon repressor/biotin-[acetyl-CoA-carboxylase] ligase
MPPSTQSSASRKSESVLTFAGASEAIWEAVSPLLPGFTIEVVPELDSTNSELMRRARGGLTAPVLLVAERQTAGRGRLGRTWHSGVEDPTASLTFSLGIALAPSTWAGLSLAVGVSLADALHPAIRLKWPNDLWLHDRKLGGILIETGGFAEQGARRYAVIGVGINIAPRLVAGASTPPAWLNELLPDIGPGQALLRVAAGLVSGVQAFETFGFEPFQARFFARDALRDRPVILSDGTAGTAHGVSETGGLLVHTAGGMAVVTSSEVSVRPAR